MLKNSKTLKVLIAFFLVLSMVFVFVGCGSKENNKTDDSKDNGSGVVEENNDNSDDGEDATAKVDTTKFGGGDSRLVGEWICVGYDNKGDYSLGIVYTYDADLFITYDGKCYGALIEALYDPNAWMNTSPFHGSWLDPLATIEAKKGEFVFKDVSVIEDSPVEVKATYTINDIEKASYIEDEEINNIHRDTADDQLVIHFTGEANMGPTDIRKIDATLVYEKSVVASSDNDGILWSGMCGEWKDNYGNLWKFISKESDGLSFTMTTPKGKVHEGSSVGISAYEVDGNIIHSMNINYKNQSMSDIYHAKVISFDGAELCLEQENGQTLTFTKQGI